jgi:iron complex transport system ATP-binding protein
MVLMGRTPYLNWLGQVSALDEEIAKSAMEKTETWDLRDRRIGELSGGEQQSLLLARALAQKAPLLLLDEPTTHLDLHHQISLLEQVRRLAKQEGLTVIAVLHDLNLVSRFADHILLLLDGKVRAFGRVNAIMKPALLREAFQVPLSILKDPRWRFPIVIPPDTTP